MYSPVTRPFGPIVCSTTSRLKVCWFNASRVAASDLRKAAIIAFGLSGIGGGSESIETWITPALVFADANALCWAITKGAENKQRISEPSSLREREVGFDMLLFFEPEKTFACCRRPGPGKEC